MLRPKSSTGSYKSIAELAEDSRVKNAFQILDGLTDELMRDHIEICEIPAPIFKERERANYFIDRFTRLGLSSPRIDEAGNATACWPSETPASSYFCLSAHLDTVFPPDTDCRVRKRNEKYFAPGIGDNASGLAGLLAIARALAGAEIEPAMPILFAATVGEEGIGDLYGARYLFKESEYAGRIPYFVSFDGPGIERITHRALGSKRYRVLIKGPGGHSWGDFGIVNPNHAISRAAAKMADYDAPQQPRTSYNIGILKGGSSVNAITEQAEMEVDLRSVSESQLDKLEAYFLRAVEEAVSEEMRRGSRFESRLEVDVKMIGHRPSGEVPLNAPLVRKAVEATRFFGASPYLECASTDSNIPISMGLEAVTIGAGGSCGNCHTLNEWYESADRETSLKRALLLMLSMTGVK